MGNQFADAKMRKCANYISTTFLVAIIAFNFLLVSCEYKTPEPAYKKDTILPAITTTGANTFGCKLNGSYWLAVPNKSFQASYSKGAISLRFDKSGDNQYGIIVLSSSKGIVNGVGEYNFNAKFRAYYTNNVAIYSINDSTFSGSISILRLDSFSRIISGTFEYSPENSSVTPSKIYITEGRFDLKY